MGDSTLATGVKARAQDNLMARRLPSGSWPHNPVSNSLGSWEARMRQRELTPVLQALGGLRGQSTLNLESGIGILKEQAQVSQSRSLRFSIAQAAEAGLKHLILLLPLSHVP